MNSGRKSDTLLLAALLASGCLDTFGYSDSGQAPSTTDTATQTLPTSGAPDTANVSESTAYSTTSFADTSAMTSATEIMSDPDTAIDSDTNSATNSASTTSDDPGFFFADDDFDAYVQVDRHGAVEAGTVGIRASGGLGLTGEDIAIRDAYNASNPTEDVAMMWVVELAESIMFFHDNLDMEIEGLGLTPATPDQAIMQVGPVILPDTIKYDPSNVTGYPNGRKLTDPVVDITLAALLLDLNIHPLDTLVGQLNPYLNDVAFAAEFPYLAPPHVP